MPLPKDKLARVIVNTDAKNEADDQYCIVQALLSPSFELAGLIPAHFGTRRNTRSMEESREEIDLLLKLMNLTGKVTVANGAPTALPDDKTPVPSEGAELIIREAMKDDDRPLHVAFLGPLTDMASALLMEPKIASRNVRVVWIGGGRWPVGGSEFNLSNDIHAANVVFRSSVELWQLPMTIYQMIAVSYAELEARPAWPARRLSGRPADRVQQPIPCRADRISLAGRYAVALGDHEPEWRHLALRAGAGIQPADELHPYRPQPAGAGL